MIREALQALFFIIIAEMGDKTQMLAMAFATKYSFKKVLLGVFIGSLLNHGLAALLGVYISERIPLDTIKLVTAIAFIVFGIWALKIDDKEEEDSRGYKLGAVLTVAMAFFVGEIGDKTQLTVMTLSSQSNYPQFILLGTVLGMVATSAIGVFVAIKLGKKIPEATMKIASATIFIVFGLVGLREAVNFEYLNNISIAIFLIGLAIIVTWRLRCLLELSSKQTAYKKVATELYLNTQKLQQALLKACEENIECSSCKGKECTLWSINKYLSEAQAEEKFLLDKPWKLPICEGKLCSGDNVKDSLIEAVGVCLECPSHQVNCIGNQTRESLELLYFGKKITFTGSIKKYYEQIKVIDPHFFN